MKYNYFKFYVIIISFSLFALLTRSMALSFAGCYPDGKGESKIQALEKEAADLEKLTGVRIVYKYNPLEYFSDKQRSSPILAKGTQIELDQADSVMAIVRKFLSSYSAGVLRKNLTRVCISETLEFYGKAYGGTSSYNSIYISVNRKKNPTNSFILGTLHSEFSSILQRNYAFPYDKWNDINEKTWKYPDNPLELLGSGNPYEQTEERLDRGFIVKYSEASIEQDFNMFVRYLMQDRSLVLDVASKHTRIWKKLQLVIKFYGEIDESFQFE
jgi:hypothetical protein